MLFKITRVTCRSSISLFKTPKANICAIFLVLKRFPSANGQQWRHADAFLPLPNYFSDPIRQNALINYHYIDLRLGHAFAKFQVI